MLGVEACEAWIISRVRCSVTCVARDGVRKDHPVRDPQVLVDSSGEISGGAVAADAVLDPQRAVADGGNLFRWFVGLNLDQAV